MKPGFPNKAEWFSVSSQVPKSKAIQFCVESEEKYAYFFVAFRPIEYLWILFLILF